MTPAQQAIVDTWEQHLEAEFGLNSTEAALATMTDDPYVIHAATPEALGVGMEGVREFYSQHFLSKVPPDAEMTPISRMPAAPTSESTQRPWASGSGSRGCVLAGFRQNRSGHRLLK